MFFIHSSSAYCIMDNFKLYFFPLDCEILHAGGIFSFHQISQLASIVFDRQLYKNVALLQCKHNLMSCIHEIKKKNKTEFCCDPILIKRNMCRQVYVPKYTKHMYKENLLQNITADFTKWMNLWSFLPLRFLTSLQNS